MLCLECAQLRCNSSHTRAVKSGKITSGGSQRAAALDMLRGIALIEMIVYHGLYDWVFVLAERCLHAQQAGILVQQSICWLFILLSGAVLNYGRRPSPAGNTGVFMRHASDASDTGGNSF